MGIMKNALRERIRRKDIYVVIMIGMLIVTMCMSGTATLAINGVSVTEFEMLMPLVLNVISVLGGGIAVALSLRTIPNEYERRTSHLIWIRGVSQWKYHGQLALANVISSVGALFILYAGVMVFAAVKGEYGVLAKGPLAFAVFAVGTAAVSLFTSAVSLVVPGMAAGVICTAFMLIGTLHPILETISGIVSGAARGLLNGILFVVPSLYAVESQAASLLSGKTVQIHEILGGLLVLYVCTVMLYVFHRREA